MRQRGGSQQGTCALTPGHSGVSGPGKAGRLGALVTGQPAVDAHSTLERGRAKTRVFANLQTRLSMICQTPELEAQSTGEGISADGCNAKHQTHEIIHLPWRHPSFFKSLSLQRWHTS